MLISLKVRGSHNRGFFTATFSLAPNVFSRFWLAALQISPQDLPLSQIIHHHSRADALWGVPLVRFLPVRDTLGGERRHTRSFLKHNDLKNETLFSTFWYIHTQKMQSYFIELMMNWGVLMSEALKSGGSAADTSVSIVKWQQDGQTVLGVSCLLVSLGSVQTSAEFSTEQTGSHTPKQQHNIRLIFKLKKLCVDASTKI